MDSLLLKTLLDATSILFVTRLFQNIYFDYLEIEDGGRIPVPSGVDVALRGRSHHQVTVGQASLEVMVMTTVMVIMMFMIMVIEKVKNVFFIKYMILTKYLI